MFGITRDGVVQVFKTLQKSLSIEDLGYAKGTAAGDNFLQYAMTVQRIDFPAIEKSTSLDELCNAASQEILKIVGHLDKLSIALGDDDFRNDMKSFSKLSLQELMVHIVEQKERLKDVCSTLDFDFVPLEQVAVTAVCNYYGKDKTVVLAGIEADLASAARDGDEKGFERARIALVSLRSEFQGDDDYFDLSFHRYRALEEEFRAAQREKRRDEIRHAMETAAERLGDSEVKALKRHVHTIKGSAGMFGFLKLAKLALDMECQLDHYSRGDIDFRGLETHLNCFLGEVTLLFELAVKQGLGQKASGEALSFKNAKTLKLFEEEFGRRISDIANTMLEAGMNPDLKGPVVQARKTEGNFNEQMGCVSEVVSETAQTLGIRFSAVAEQNLPKMVADWVEIRQMFYHLANNAIDAILAARRENGEIKLSAERNGDNLIIKFSDNGEGIAPDKLAGIFEPGNSTREHTTRSGAGQGTTDIKRIVEEHGGSVRVESEVGVGTTFIISLPLG